MTDMVDEAAIRTAIAGVVRGDGGRLLSSLVANLRDFQLAEDSLQDALESALIHWTRSGLPTTPAAWLMQTARRKALDRLRRAANFRSKSSQIALAEEIIRADRDAGEKEAISDDRLRLIFTCCHPALDSRTSVALTLRSVAGLTTEEIAKAFLVSNEAMAQRLVRARHKIAQANIPFEVPRPETMAERLDAVLTVIYLIFTEGHSSSDGQLFRINLCEEAIRLVTILADLLPDQPEIEGLTALMLLHTARTGTRLSGTGEMICLEDQDRSQWDSDRIAAGLELIQRALARKSVGQYQLQAAIAALHAESPSFAETDWAQIALIYAGLFDIRPNPVFELNRIVAVSYSQGAEVALVALDGLALPLSGYQPYYAVRADLLVRLGDREAAGRAYRRAIDLSSSPAERQFLKRKANVAPRDGE
ncbi:RNA polymerase sigma factor [Mesorhizobium sp. CAU 1741]|uniref:RNA polymerase sigma factor n=1 Tax=Mesorhizobium sp. CAU 1741 TaxID=3140366 RepID=UPI00325B1E13